jgi:hypothetical protein
MKELTFAFDCQLNDQEDYIKEGTKVKIYDHPLKKPGFTPVIIESAHTYKEKAIKVPSKHEWFANTAFIELRN